MIWSTKLKSSWTPSWTAVIIVNSSTRSAGLDMNVPKTKHHGSQQMNSITRKNSFPTTISFIPTNLVRTIFNFPLHFLISYSVHFPPFLQVQYYIQETKQTKPYSTVWFYIYNYKFIFPLSLLLTLPILLLTLLPPPHLVF